MFSTKIYHNNKFLTLLLIAYLIISGTFLIAHNFSHHIAKSFSNNVSVNYQSEQQNHSSDDCALCSLFVLNNHLLATKLISCLILSGYFATHFLVKDKIKLSYLRSSFLSRAPPTIS